MSSSERESAVMISPGDPGARRAATVALSTALQDGPQLFPYVCGEGDFAQADGPVTMEEMTAHWRSHQPGES